MKVNQFYNKNQFVITEGSKRVFQSYDSTIAINDNGKITLGRHWDYSKTTSKHLYLFINEYCHFNDFNIEMKNKKQWIENKIKTGEIKYNEDLI